MATKNYSTETIKHEPPGRVNDVGEHLNLEGPGTISQPQDTSEATVQHPNEAPVGCLGKGKSSILREF